MDVMAERKISRAGRKVFQALESGVRNAGTNELLEIVGRGWGIGNVSVEWAADWLYIAVKFTHPTVNCSIAEAIARVFGGATTTLLW